MPHYKLTYFDAKSRAESLRYLFILAKVDYEDVRIDMKDWMAAKKRDYTFQQLPVLHVDSKEINQSIAIAYYLGKTFNMMGSNLDEETDALVIMEQSKDMLERAGMIFWTVKDPEAFKEKKAEYENGFLKSSLEALEKILKSCKSGYFAGNSLTVADVMFYAAIEAIPGYMNFTEDLLHHYPTLAALRGKISSIPEIKAYREKRPVTKF